MHFPVGHFPAVGGRLCFFPPRQCLVLVILLLGHPLSNCDPQRYHSPTKVNLPSMLQHRFLARRASFRLRFRPCWYKDFFKGKGVPPTAHPALSRQRLRSGFVFFPRFRSGFVLTVRPILRQRTDAISLNLLTGSLCIQPYIYIYISF